MKYLIRYQKTNNILKLVVVVPSYIIPELEKLRQEDFCEFKIELFYTLRLTLFQKQTITKHPNKQTTRMVTETVQ